MHAIADAYEMLKLQWNALGQSPDHGIALLMKLKSQYPEVPFVFYSRKVTPEDVIRVLRAGAVDVIRKGALPNEHVLARLAAAQALWCRQDVRIIRDSGLNVNVTAVSPG
jgi:DNA-binding NarL/FixJ family response regulator